MAVPSQLTPEMLVGLLGQFINPETAQSASGAMKSVMKLPNFIPLLADQMGGNPQAEIRQLAAILLRKRILPGWGALTAEQQAQMKRGLLQRMVDEEVNVVRRSVAQVVSALSKLIIEEWKTELFKFLETCSSSQNAGHREVAQIVFAALADDSPESLFPQLAAVFAKGLKDAESAAVRAAAVKGLEALAASAETPKGCAHIHSLLEPLSIALDCAATDGDEDLLCTGIEVLNDLIESTGVFKNTDLPDICRFVLRVAGNANFSPNLRDVALHFIHLVAKQKPRILTKSGLVHDVLRVVLPMSTEPIDTGEVDDEDLENHPSSVASRCIDSLAINLPSKIVYPLVIEAIDPFCRSDDPDKKRAALNLLGILAEGCEDLMRKQLPTILPFVFASFDDPNEKVQGAAGVCLGYMATYLHPEITQSRNAALECLLRGINTPDERTREKICYAVEMFCDNLEAEDIAPHLNILLPALIRALHNSTSLQTKQSCLGAVGSVCAAADEKFSEHAEQVFAILDEALSKTTTQYLELRSSATMCAAAIVSGVPQHLFLPYRQRLIELVLEGLKKIDDASIRENSYRFFASIVAWMRDDFAPLLPEIVPWAVATCLSEEGIVPHRPEGENGSALLQGLRDDDDVDISDGSDVDGYSVRTGYMDEKEAALEFIQNTFRFVSAAHTAPFLKRTIEVLNVTHKFIHSGVRTIVPSVIESVLYSVHIAYPPPSSSSTPPAPAELPPRSGPFRKMPEPPRAAWHYKPGIPCQSPLHSNTKQLWNKSLWPIVKIILTQELDKAVVASCCRSLGTMLDNLGPDLFQPSETVGDQYTVILNVVKSLLKGEHPALQFGDGLVAEDEGSRAADEEPLDNISMLIEGLSKSMGPQFDTFFAEVQEFLLKLASHPTSTQYQCSGIGVYAEGLLRMGTAGGAVAYADRILPYALRGAKTEGDPLLRQNGAYCLGVLAEVASCSPGVETQTVAILQALHGILTMDQAQFMASDREMFDNAVSALGRCIVHIPAGKFPLEDVSLLFLKSLPLKEDIREVDPVIKTLLYLCHSGRCKEQLEANSAEFLRASILTLADSRAEPEPEQASQLHAVISEMLRQLGQEHASVQELGRVLIEANEHRAVEMLRAIFQHVR